MRQIIKGNFVGVVLLLSIFTIISYFLYKISGRATPADGVRPFIALLLWWLATMFVYRLRLRIYARLLNLIAILAIFFVVIFFAYYHRINSFITGDDMVAILQSNVEEQFDFILFNILTFSGIGSALLVSGITLVVVEILFYFAKAKQAPRHSKVVLVTALIFQVAAIIIVTQLRPVKFYFIMKEQYYQQIAVFNELNSQVQNTSQTPAVKERTGELYVLVMGESLNRDLMGCYNHFIDNTPFLDKLTQKSNTVMFSNAYASFVNTVPAITNALSQGNIDKGLTFPYGENLFSILRSANVKSAWISNQVRQSRFDTPIAAIADKTDFQYFSIHMSEGSSKQQRPDEYILPQIKSYLDQAAPEENHLLVIHLMGSHSPYDNRYPDDFKEYSFSKESTIGICAHSFNYKSEINEYLTTIRYNDQIISQIYDLVSNRPDFSAYVYLSDHAEEVTPPSGRHNMGQFSFNMTRIPLIVNVSDDYAQLYPETVQALHNNKHKPFTNDTLYELMLSLMQIKTEAYDPEFSLANDNYSKTFEQTKIVEEKRIINDPFLRGSLNIQDTAQSRQSPSFMLNDVQSLFQTGLALNNGIKQLRIKATLTSDKSLALLSDEDVTISNLLEQLPYKPETILLHIAAQQDIQESLAAAENLATVYPQVNFILSSGSINTNSQIQANCANLTIATDLSALEPAQTVTALNKLVDTDSNAYILINVATTEVLTELPDNLTLIGVNSPIDLSSPAYFNELEAYNKLDIVCGSFKTPFDLENQE